MLAWDRLEADEKEVKRRRMRAALAAPGLEEACWAYMRGWDLMDETVREERRGRMLLALAAAGAL